MNCPCHSGKLYAECCKPLHGGRPAENALLLMRSRYAAYVLGLADYIIRTGARPQKRDEILRFSRETVFQGLTIHEWIDGEKEATVTFTAHLLQGGKDVSFTEKSRFVKAEGLWIYQDGAISQRR